MSPFGIGFNSPPISYYQLAMRKLGRCEDYCYHRYDSALPQYIIATSFSMSIAAAWLFWHK